VAATAATDAALLARCLDPRFFDLDALAVVVFATRLVSFILGLAVGRSRQSGYGQAAARARTNLARYVGPRLADTLVASDAPMGAVRRQDVAVLFIDVRGFTALAERRSPEEIVGRLRAFHGRLAAVVSARGGPLDEFVADGLTATFGTPLPGPGGGAERFEFAGVGAR
jgi:adenylate cyclase